MKYFFLTVITALAWWTQTTVAASPPLVLPYAALESFVVVQGYDSPPTHIKKDEYALDFSQGGCDAYGKKAVASAPGTVALAQTAGYNGGYGAQILIDHGDHTMTRYAHLIAGSIVVRENDIVPQGSAIGDIGDTGLVAGNACKEHPGTHLHFAQYEKQADGTYTALKPEPISDYQNLTAGSWYQARIATARDSQSDTFSVASATTHTAMPDSKDTVPAGGVVASIATPDAIDPSPAVATSALTLPATAPIIASSTSPSVSGFQSGGVAVSSGGGNNPVPSDLHHDAATNDASSSTLSVSISLTSSTASGTPSVDAGSTPSGTPPTPSSTTTGTPPISEMSLSSTSSLSLPQLAPVTPLLGAKSIAVFATSTLAVDLAWQSPANASGGFVYAAFEVTSSIIMAIATDSIPLWTGTSTRISFPVVPDGATHLFAIMAADGSGAASLATTTLIAPNWLAVAQPYDGDVSLPSWYDDTWHQLGAGFYGTIRSLTLNGYVNDPHYLASHLSLDEFLDGGYAVKNQSYVISDEAPFTATSSLVAIGNLNIPLQPNKYYRLNASNDFQNRSVILRGTSATGTSMSDGFVSGVGRVENQYPFYPYLAWTFIPNWPLLLPPNPPPDLSVSFDATDVALDVTWGAAADPDTTSTLLAYEVMVATSTSPEDFAWQPVGKNFSTHVPISFPNTYQIAVRARDDLGNVSEPASMAWHFPDGFYPLPSQMNYDSAAGGAPEKFHLDKPAVISSIGLWTSRGNGPFGIGFDYAGIFTDASGTPGNPLATSVLTQASWPHEVWHDFSEPVSLLSGDYWIAPVSGPAQYNGAFFYGDTAGQMYFRLKIGSR
jgi:Peptidase family M23